MCTATSLNPKEITVNDLLEEILATTGINADVEYHPLPQDDPRRRRPNISRAKSLLGWRPKIGLHTGLERTCAWFAEELGIDLPPSSRAAGAMSMSYAAE